MSQSPTGHTFDPLLGLVLSPTGPSQALTDDQYFGQARAWQSVASSNLVAVSYQQHGADGTLGVRFGSNGVARSEYRYFGVPPSVYEALLAAGSHGTYHAQFVKLAYPFTRAW